MNTLITYPAGFGSLSLSPFCVKAMYLLNFAGAAWVREDSYDPRRMPHAKLPVLRTADGLIHDSDNIRAYLEAQGVEFMEGLSDQDQAKSHMLMRMAEEHLYFVLVLDRWEREEVWPTIRETYFHEIPGLLRRLISRGIRRTALRGLKMQGLGRMTWAERMSRVEQDLKAIHVTLGNSSFLFGETLSLADLAVVPILDAMRATPVETPLGGRVREDVVLSAYIDRVHDALTLTS